MKFPKGLMVAAFVVLVIFPITGFAEQITINWWFAHGGRLGEKVQSIVSDFNSMQSKYKVVATYKGNYSDTMTAGIAAFRSKKHPHILQVYEVGTAAIMVAVPTSYTWRICGCFFERKAAMPAVIVSE